MKKLNFNFNFTKEHKFWAQHTLLVSGWSDELLIWSQIIMDVCEFSHPLNIAINFNWIISSKKHGSSTTTTTTLTNIKVWEKVTMKWIKSIWISLGIESIDFNYIPIIFYVCIAEWDLQWEEEENISRKLLTMSNNVVLMINFA